jgi:hypothetical protein
LAVIHGIGKLGGRVIDRGQFHNVVTMSGVEKICNGRGV